LWRIAIPAESLLHTSIIQDAAPAETNKNTTQGVSTWSWFSVPVNDAEYLELDPLELVMDSSYGETITFAVAYCATLL
jgi:hypothetical protein